MQTSLRGTIFTPYTLSFFAMLLSAIPAAAVSDIGVASAAVLDENASATVELPLLAGWYQGHLVHYISTDMSDQGMAAQTGTNYVPRLKHALLDPMPGRASAVDRVYKFSNFDQGSVFPSAPSPAGPTSGSVEYTPLWVVYMVNWLPGAQAHLLRSEEEVLDAEDKKLVSLQATDVIVNCPILFLQQDGIPKGMKVHLQR